MLFADAEGYARLTRADEVAALATLMAHRRSMLEVVATHGGRFAGSAGDSLLAEFPSVDQAVGAAGAMQGELYRRNQRLPPEHRLEFRVGVNLGDVLDNGEGIYGHAVNLAARLQALAAPGGVALSSAAYDQVRHRPGLAFRDGGLQRVKSVSEPLRVFHLALTSSGHALTAWRRAWPVALVASSALLAAALSLVLAL